MKRPSEWNGFVDFFRLAAFAELIASVEAALTALSRQPERVQALFGLYLDDLAAGTGTSAAGTVAA